MLLHGGPSREVVPLVVHRNAFVPDRSFQAALHRRGRFHNCLNVNMLKAAAINASLPFPLENNGSGPKKDPKNGYFLGFHTNPGASEGLFHVQQCRN